MEPLRVLPERTIWRSLQRGLWETGAEGVSFRGKCITCVTGDAVEPSQGSHPRTHKKAQKRVSFKIGPQIGKPYWGHTSQGRTSLLPLALTPAPLQPERPEIILSYKAEGR